MFQSTYHLRFRSNDLTGIYKIKFNLNIYIYIFFFKLILKCEEKKDHNQLDDHPFVILLCVNPD
jgi:hypothetical protein